MNELNITPEDLAAIQIDDDLKQSFALTVKESIKSGLFKEFCRLNGYTAPKSPLDLMIDQATGRFNQIADEFFMFVYEYVFKPVLTTELNKTPI